MKRLSLRAQTLQKRILALSLIPVCACIAMTLPVFAQPPGQSIVVTPVVITFETIGAGEPLPAEAFRSDETSAWIDEIVRGLYGVALTLVPNADTVQWLVRTNTLADEAHSAIQSLCTSSAPSVLLHHLRIKVGLPRGWKHEGVPLVYDVWKPVVNQSTALYRVVVRGCTSGDVEWRGEFQMRDIPLPRDERLAELLRGTHESFLKENYP